MKIGKEVLKWQKEYLRRTCSQKNFQQKTAANAFIPVAKHFCLFTTKISIAPFIKLRPKQNLTRQGSIQ